MTQQRRKPQQRNSGLIFPVRGRTRFQARMERQMEWQEDARIKKGNGDKRQRAGISPEKPAQHSSNARDGKKRSPTLWGRIVYKWLRKSTVQQNQVSTKQIEQPQQIEAKTLFDVQWKLQSMLLWCLSSPKTQSNWPTFLSLWVTSDSTESLYTLLVTRESMPKHILSKGCTRSWIS